MLALNSNTTSSIFSLGRRGNRQERAQIIPGKSVFPYFCICSLASLCKVASIVIRTPTTPPGKVRDSSRESKPLSALDTPTEVKQWAQARLNNRLLHDLHQGDCSSMNTDFQPTLYDCTVRPLRSSSSSHSFRISADKGRLTVKKRLPPCGRFSDATSR